MTHEIIRKASHAYLVIRDNHNMADNISYQMAMLEHCPIDGLLPFSQGYLDGSIVCQYEITSLTPLTAMAGISPFSLADIKRVFAGILKTVDMTEDCLLSADHLLLEPEYCYVSAEKGQKDLRIPYVPFYTRDIFSSLADFSTFLATHARKDSQDAVVLACRIRHELQEPNVVLSQLKPYLADESEPDPNTSKLASDSQREPMSTAPIFPASSPDPGKPAEKSSGDMKGRIPLSFLREQLPERFTVLVALCGIPAAVLIYFVLHAYALWSMTASEQIICSVAAAAIVILLIIMLRKLLAGSKATFSPRQVNDSETGSGNGELSSPEDSSSSSIHMPISDGYPSTAGIEGDVPSVCSAPAFTADEDECTVLLSDYLASGKKVRPRLEPSNLSGTSECDPSPDLAIFFERPRLLIGSSDTLCDKVIRDPTVSRLHAEVFCLHDRWYLADLNSKNGTFLNREMLPAEKKVPLTDGDVLRFGAAGYLFREN